MVGDPGLWRSWRFTVLTYQFIAVIHLFRAFAGLGFWVGTDWNKPAGYMSLLFGIVDINIYFGKLEKV